MRMGQGVRTDLGHGGITCVLQTQFSSFFFCLSRNVTIIFYHCSLRIIYNLPQDPKGQRNVNFAKRRDLCVCLRALNTNCSEDGFRSTCITDTYLNALQQ